MVEKNEKQQNSSPGLIGVNGPQPARKKRVGKACDSCRLKKTKCSGKQPCEKCLADNKICIYTERKKSRDKTYSYDYVEMMEKRLCIMRKALLHLCEMVKLDQEQKKLVRFKDQLVYDENNVNCPFSINQIVSLLISRQELDHDLGDQKKFIERIDEAERLTHKLKPESSENKKTGKKSRRKCSIKRKSRKAKSDVPSKQFEPSSSSSSKQSSSIVPPPKISQKSSSVLPVHREATYPQSLNKINEEYLGDQDLPMVDLDLSPFDSGAQLAAAAMNGYFNPNNHSGSSATSEDTNVDENGSGFSSASTGSSAITLNDMASMVDGTNGKSKVPTSENIIPILPNESDNVLNSFFKDPNQFIGKDSETSFFDSITGIDSTPATLRKPTNIDSPRRHLSLHGRPNRSFARDTRPYVSSPMIKGLASKAVKPESRSL